MLVCFLGMYCLYKSIHETGCDVQPFAVNMVVALSRLKGENHFFVAVSRLSV